MELTANQNAYSTRPLWDRIKARQGDYEQTRDPWESQWETIIEHLRPDLVAGLLGQKDIGEFEGSKIVEGTGPHAVRVWQRGFQANLISRKIEWFREQVKEPPAWTGVKFKGNDEVNKYCQELAEHLSERYRRSNYYDRMGMFTLNGGTLGSPVMLFSQDIARDRMVCEVPDYASVWLDKDIFGEDNCLHVQREWTALQAEEMFGFDQLPLSVRQQLQQGTFYAKTKYIQAIYGAGDRIYRDLPGGEMLAPYPWREHFLCTEDTDKRILRPTNKGPGYFTRPFASWHYHRNDHEVYSRTMAWWAIFDVLGSEGMWEATYGDAEYSVKPATWANAALRGLLDMSPGGDNWARNREEYETPPMFLDKGTRYDKGIDFADRLAGMVRRHFHYDFFMAVNQIMLSKQQPETAFGLSRAQAENGIQLVEEIESYEQQVLGHAHDVFIDYERLAEPAYPWGRLPKPPQILLDYSDGNVDVEFIGPLSLMQINDRQVERFYRSMEPAQIVFQAQPETLHKLKWSQILEHLLESQNFRQDDIVSEEEFVQIVEGVRQRAMQAEMAEMAPKMTQAAKNLQGKTEKGSPMAMLTGAKA